MFVRISCNKAENLELLENLEEVHMRDENKIFS